MTEAAPWGPRCSELSRGRRDPLVGTAVDAPRWLLVEHPGAWAPKVLATRPLSSVARDLEPLLAERSVRAQLVRRPGRRRTQDSDELMVALVDTTVGTVRRGTWEVPSDLLDAVRWADDGSRGPEPRSEQFILVCAHGRKDVCCALEGRPVAAALQDHWGEAVWETSHLGGDRFAANVAVLPDGAMYGRLDAALAPGVVGDHLGGRVRTEHWRGTSAWAAQESAAVAVVLAGRDGYAADVHLLGSAAAGPERWQVRVRVGDEEVRVEVTRAMRPPARLSCRATEPKSSPEFTARVLSR